MSDVAKYELDDKTVVLIEYEPSGDFQPAGADDIAGKIKDAIEPAIAGAQVVLDRARAMSPDEIEVKFGIKVSGTANWLIAKAATEGNFEITLTWKPGQETK